MIDAKAYLDTNVFIDAIEGEELLASPAKRLLEASGAQLGHLVTSELTLAEVLAPARKQIRPADLKRAYLDMLVWSGGVELVPITRDVLMESARLRESSNLKLVDAIHLATATLSGCHLFVSRDADFGRMPEGMERISSDSSKLLELFR